MTTMWSSPLLANQNFTCVKLGPGGFPYGQPPYDGGVGFQEGLYYFNGYGPEVYWRSIRNGSPSIDVVQPRYHSLLSDLLLRNMRWSRWGPNSADGRGKYLATCYFARPHNRCADWILSVKLTLSRMRTCPDGRLIFTRLVIRNPLPEPSATGRRGKPRPLILTYDCGGRSRGEGTTW
jgi:hypothetical protein